jgi:hypothetical protein
MRNSTGLDNTVIAAVIQTLASRLPLAWTVTRGAEKGRKAGGYEADARLEIRAPDGSRGSVLVEAKATLTAQGASMLAPRLVDAASREDVGGLIVAAPFLSEMTRQRLQEAGLSYLDLTGNIRIQLDRPAVYLESQGASKDPAPVQRGVRSLKGAKAARIVRALCDWRPPMGVRELARRADINAGYATRVLGLLTEEDLVERDPDGAVSQVRWAELLRRWTRDYGVTSSNIALPYLAPRGIDGVLERLAGYTGRYAITGSFAVPRAAQVARGRLLTCFMDSPDRGAEKLGLRPSDAGTNVLLVEPFDPVVYERARTEDGLRLTALSQCVADLLTGSGREPAEGESLLGWMGRNEDAWRT